MKTLIFTFTFVLLNYGVLFSQEPPYGDGSLQEGGNPDVTEYMNQNPTYAGFPKPDEVLVVFAINEIISENIKDYYVAKRNIPQDNIVGLDIPRSKLYRNGQDSAFVVGPSPWNYWGQEGIVGNDTLGWLFFKEEIANKIENYLNNTIVNGKSLAESIRYIVMCKGIPTKIWHEPYDSITWKSNYRTNTSAGALLCLINQPNPAKHFMQLLETHRTTHFNPMYGIDTNLTMDYRFKSNHFENSQGFYTQYLVSWLEGNNYNEIKALIDRSSATDYSGEKTWIIDDHYASSFTFNFSRTHYRLKKFQFNTNPEIFVSHPDWITSDSNEVMGYLSWGANCTMPSNYITHELEFDYANGAIFSSWESFNGHIFGPLPPYLNQGLLTDFIHMGGTGGGGNVFEPWTYGVTREFFTFPAYAIGYSLVDAHYMGIPLNGWKNIVVGDPLTAIAWGKQTLYENKTLSETNLFTGVVTVPGYHSLTLEDEAVVNFRHNGFITGDGFVITEGDFTINIQDWSESVLKSRGLERDVPRIIWGGYPTSTPEALVVELRLNYEGDWISIAELDPEDTEYTD